LRFDHGPACGGAVSLSLYPCYISIDDIAMEATMGETAKVFWSGRSQAVRLPKEFRIDAEEVRIRRHGEAVVLEPVAKDWAWLDAVVGTFSDDFMKDGREQLKMQERPDLDSAFE
jgi:antitoxin VapB